MPALSLRTAIVCVFALLAAALPGCGGPEGLGSIDADAARQALIAEGKPDPLAPAGQTRFQAPPKALKRPSLSQRR